MSDKKLEWFVGKTKKYDSFVIGRNAEETVELLDTSLLSEYIIQKVDSDVMRHAMNRLLEILKEHDDRITKLENEAQNE